MRRGAGRWSWRSPGLWEAEGGEGRGQEGDSLAEMKRKKCGAGGEIWSEGLPVGWGMRK